MRRLFVSFCLLLSANIAFAQSDRPMHLSAESVLLLAPNGTVLFAKNPSEDHAPASLTKLMTLYLACEDLEAGRAGSFGYVVGVDRVRQVRRVQQILEPDRQDRAGAGNARHGAE